jgi:electron transfer flavoprotein beta subunit
LFHVIVGIKQVPDTSNIRIDPETGNLIRQGVPSILNPYDAHAVAAAVELKCALGGKVTVISMGPASTVASIRECIESGADEGVLLSARQFSGADTLATSYVLAEAIRELHAKEPVHLLLFGKQAIDGDTAQVGPGVAARLGYPLVTYAVKIHEVNLEENSIVVERKTERWNEILRAQLPVVLTCEKEIADIPYASLPDLITSLAYEPAVWTADNPIQYNPDQIGLKGSPTMVSKVGNPAQHARGEVIHVSDSGVQAAVVRAFELAKSKGIQLSKNGVAK